MPRQKSDAYTEDSQPVKPDSSLEEIIDELSERLRQNEGELKRMLRELESLKREVTGINILLEQIKAQIGLYAGHPDSRETSVSRESDPALQAVSDSFQLLSQKISSECRQNTICMCALHLAKGMIATASKDGMVFVREIKSGELLVDFNEKNSEITRMAFSYDGRLLACVCAPNRIIFYDVKAEEKVEETNKFRSTINAIAFHPLKPILAVGTDDSELTTFEFLQKKYTSSQLGKTPITALMFRQDAGYLFSGHSDGTLNMLTFPSLKVEKAVNAHKSAIDHIASYKGEKIIATTAADGLIVIWSVPDLESIKTFQARSILAMDFVKDPPFLCTVSIDGTVHTWRTKP